jgi:hypothetical protein
MEKNKVTKQISEDIEVDYYFLDSRKVYERMQRQEAERLDTIGFI